MDESQPVAVVTESNMEAMIEQLVQIGEPAIGPLIERLSNSSWSIRRVAYEALCKIGSGAVGPLIELLSNPNWRNRRIASEALGRIGHASAVSPLLERLRDEEISVRRAAGDALAAIGGEAIDQMIELLTHRAEVFRIHSASALGKAKDRRAVQPLISVLQDDDEYSWDVRSAVAIALGEIGDRLAVDPLLAMLKLEDDSSNVIVSRAIVRALGQLQDERAIDSLVDELRSIYPELAIAVLKALRAIGNSSVELPILRLVDAGVVPTEVRRAAILALGELGGILSIPVMIEGTRSDDRIIRLASVQALGELGDSRALECLFEAFQDDERSVREAAVDSLGKIGDTKAVEQLLVHLDDERWWVRGNTAVAIGNLRHHCDRCWEKKELDDIRLLTGHDCSIPALMEALLDSNDEVVYASSVALMKVTEEDFGRDYEQWKQWWQSNSFASFEDSQ
jgi:HEAT repeat protein